MSKTLESIIEEIILDFHQRNISKTTPREVVLEPLPNKATVCMGVRRSGKSTLMMQQIQRLESSGVLREHMVYINLFDDRLHQLQELGLGIILDVYYRLFPHKKGADKVYFFFDELQVIPNWEPFIDRLMRTEVCEVYITGSSAQYLSKEIATQMRGRALSWEVFPFSFTEFLRHSGVEYGQHLSSKDRAFVQEGFDRYWGQGGFPETIGLSEHLRIRIHQEYLSTIIFRDIIERHDISHPKAIRDLVQRLLENVGSLYSLNKLDGYLKSLGHKVPKATLSLYLGWLEDAYFIFTVKLFDSSLARVNTNPKKAYCIDHALVRSCTSGVLLNSGHLLENLVFLSLRRLSPGIHYYKTNQGWEVDFIVVLYNGEKMLVQVCEQMEHPETSKRELRALRQGMKELSLMKGFVVTREESTEIEQDDGSVIYIVPAWKFCLMCSSM
jgi:uncharacterized protein